VTHFYFAHLTDWLGTKNGGGWRLIFHLSHPEGNSVNSHTDPELCTVNYSSLDNILDKVYDLGKGSLLAKMDIKSAFRLLIINPADFDLMRIKFYGHYFIDKCLPMGCCISPKLFETFSTFLQWVVEIKSGKKSIDHYLDDFFFMGAKNTENCSFLMSTFQNVCDELGVPIAANKTMGPTILLSFLGFTIDTVRMMVLIPHDKIRKLKQLLEPMLLRNKISLKELESVTGLMSFCAKAIPSSRAFIRRFFDLINDEGRYINVVNVSMGIAFFLAGFGPVTKA